MLEREKVLEGKMRVHVDSSRCLEGSVQLKIKMLFFFGDRGFIRDGGCQFQGRPKVRVLMWVIRVRVLGTYPLL